MKAPSFFIVLFSTATQPLPKSQDRAYGLAAGLFFLVLALVFYLPSLGLLPRGIHEWAQADRLSLGLNFYSNGFHFFRPQTQNLNSIDGVVGVEFPLIPYLAALGAKLSGKSSLVYWYRGLTAGAAWLGYYFLFRLVFERTHHFLAALLPGTFLATSPVFAYYAGSFLPDPVGASLAVVASYYLLRYAKQPQFGYAAGAILCFTLATLVKTSAAIYLVAAMSTLLFWSYLQPALLTLRQKMGLLGLCIGSVGLIAGYTLFNRYLNELYGSTLFLANVMPIASEQQYATVMTRITDVWLYEYFTKAHYFALAISALICVLSLPRLVRTEWLWASQLLLAAIGGWAFFRLMGRQLADHDYYVLAPYWPGLTLLVALATVLATTWQVPNGRWTPSLQIARHLAFGASLVILLVLALPTYRARMSDSYLPFSDYYTYRWMQGGAAALATAKVPDTNTLLVLGEEAPNLSLVYFDRRGLVWKPDVNRMPSAELLEKMTTFGLDLVVMRSEVFQGLDQAHPDLRPAFITLIRNKNYVLLKRISAPKHW